MIEEVVNLQLLINENDKMEALSMNGKEFTFGRSPDCALIINDQSYSRFHFKVYFLNDQLVVSDLKSANGTFLNGNMVTEEFLKVKRGDILSTANSKITIQIKDYSSPDNQNDSTKIISLENLKEVSFDEIDFDTTILSQKIFELANIKVENMIKEAGFKYESIVSSAKKEYEERVLDNEKNYDLYLIKKKIEVDDQIEKHKKELSKLSLIELEKEKQNELVKVQNELSRVKKDFFQKQDAELAIIEKNIKTKNDDFVAKSLKIDKDLQKKNKELEALNSVFSDKQKKLEVELEKNLVLKKAEITEAESKFEKIKANHQLKIEEEIKSQKIELQRLVDNYEKTTIAKQLEISKLETLYENQMKSQLQYLDSEVEKKKSFYENQLLQLSNKIEAGQVDLSELVSKYKKIRLEEEEAIVLLEKLKDKANEGLITHQKLLFEIESKYSSKFAELESNLTNLTQKKQELELSTGQLGKKSFSLTSEIVENDEKLKLQKNLALTLSQQIKDLSTKKDLIDIEYLASSEKNTELNRKLEISKLAINNLKSTHEKEILALNVVLLEKKAEIDSELRIHKDQEKKRIQIQTLEQINQINKVKEESLKLILDLEDSITKELISSTSRVFAASVGISKFREIAPDYETTIRTSLKSGVLKLLRNELSPVLENKARKFKLNTKTLKPIILSSIVTSFFVGYLPYLHRQVEDYNDPVRKEIAERARVAAIVPLRKFEPVMVSTLGANFVDSALYTRGYCDVYAKEEFRSELMKNGSEYLYKHWQIDEGKSIESFAMIFSLIENLKARGEKIDPENEKHDIDKLRLLEKETIKKLENILGNEVRLEAAMKFQVRYYNEYLAKNPQN